MITLIAAIGKNRELGKDNQLLWRLPNDLKRFKQLTLGHAVIMGRKTFDSLPGILPNRRHIILTTNPNYTNGQAEVVHSLQKAFEKAAETDENPFVLGGGEIYKLTLPFADRVELTVVDGTFEADTFFPSLPTDVWQKTFVEEHPADEKHAYAYSFQTFTKK
ncbi:MAG: diacylglycerol kinase [Bacteroidetes bacterium HGW-Bacteroidetes-15]|jgi:dihydrofolate reductase|nr:MAG: diacylglycerol kinase [Bacteroidetes bacterium HGW-Bacteroidetes-15]PKP43958.1 MAG: diacylglycerol kinase [Bacteroidetes bacterium HGW-Bacteroidetes-13]